MKNYKLINFLHNYYLISSYEYNKDKSVYEKFPIIDDFNNLGNKYINRIMTQY